METPTHEATQSNRPHDPSNTNTHHTSRPIPPSFQYKMSNYPSTPSEKEKSIRDLDKFFDFGESQPKLDHAEQVCNALFYLW